MSKYTTQLRWIVEQLGDGLEVPEGQTYADNVYKYIGLTDYPIFNEEYRVVLNDMIINHYYFMEIGFETAAQFAWYMKRTMREIMPKYNMMYKALEMLGDENPLTDFSRHRVEDWNVHVDDVSTSTGNSSSTSASSTEDKTRNVFSDTPMGMLKNDGSPSVENLDYATTVNYDNSNGKANSATSSNNERLYDGDRDDLGVRNINEWGRNKSLASLVKEFAESFQNIDLLIIDDLRDLFMGLW